MTKLLDSIKLPDDIKSLSMSQLKQLSDEIRELLICTCLENGGHLASNLGIVEISIALFYVFDLPKDKVIYDVGHQSYVHKILSGRYKDFSTLRQKGGLSGFSNPKESEYDAFVTGHSSTAVSLGCGFNRANILSGNNAFTISVVGDGALTGGLTYEALNEIATIGGRHIIVINDNNMSISNNVGSTSSYLKKLRISRNYLKFKKNLNKFLSGFKFEGDKVQLRIQKIKNTFKYYLNGKIPFDQYSIPYYGPVDGNDVEEIILFLTLAKYFDGPLILHAMTKKGKGYPEAEKHPDFYHGLSPKNSDNNNCESYSSVFGNEIIKLAEKDKKITVTTAAMAHGTSLESFAVKFPDRFFDVGIAEAHAVTMNAAMAKAGFKPYFAVYSTFLQRAFDQLVHDVCIMNLPVRFIIDRAGLVGGDGETHQGIFDVSFLNILPNMTIIEPRNKSDLIKMLEFSTTFNSPLAIRYPKTACPNVSEAADIEYGKSEKIIINNNEDVVLIGCGGDCVDNCCIAAKKSNKKISVYSARFIKPIDTDLFDTIKDKKIIIVEDNIAKGSYGSSVLEYFNAKGYNTEKVHILALPDKFIPHESRKELFVDYGLDEDSIYNVINSLCD